eukprot:1147723-Pelagomonas_calceolata.AAC.4
MWSRTCTPCPGVWVREPLVCGLLLVTLGEPAASNECQEQRAVQLLSHACMREQGMACCRKVLLLPQALNINATSVSRRAGFANFSASLATLPSLVLEGCGMTAAINKTTLGDVSKKEARKMRRMRKSGRERMARAWTHVCARIEYRSNKLAKAAIYNVRLSKHAASMGIELHG